MPRVNKWNKILMKKLKKQGRSYKEIASMLKIKERAIRFHLNDTEEKRKKRNLYQKRRREKLSPEQKEKEKRQISECNKKRYQNDPRFRKKIAENLVRSRRKKKGYIEYPLKCNRCGLKIERYDDLKRVVLKSKGSQELLGVQYNKTLNCHIACWNLIPKKERLILEERNWKWIGLDVKNEIWAPIDEEGKILYSKMISDIPEVNEKLRRIWESVKEKGLDLEALKEFSSGVDYA